MEILLAVILFFTTIYVMKIVVRTSQLLVIRAENAKLKDRIIKLEAAVAGISPWLAVSITEHTRKNCVNYMGACNAIFEVNTIGGEHVLTIFKSDVFH